MKKQATVSIMMGSDSDYPLLKKSIAILKDFEVPYDVVILSAHRTPEQTKNYVKQAEKDGVKVFIGAAGKAAHLAGVIASHTTKPVIGLPIKSSALDGLDALLATVQMPKGIPVATVAIDGAENAALLAIQILAIQSEELAIKLSDYRYDVEQTILQKNKELQQELFGNEG